MGPFVPMRPLLGVIPGCSLSSGTGKSAAMNADSRGENRIHARVAPDYFGASVSNVALPTPLATDWEFRECPLVSGRCSCNACTPECHETQRRKSPMKSSPTNIENAQDAAWTVSWPDLDARLMEPSRH
jgi:hypothetical protein